MTDPWTEWNDLAVVEDPTELGSREQQLYAFGWLRTELNNGGFNQLFLNSAGDMVPVAVAAARAAGATELADLVESAMSVLGTDYATDRPTRQEILLALSDRDEDRLSDLDSQYYALEGTRDLDEVMGRLRSPA